MKIINKILFIIGIVGLYACSDIFETDLTKKDVSLLMPSDSITTNVYSNTFMWSEVEGAISYNIQIVSPSFDNIQSFVLDSTITSNKFTRSLSPGIYEWRVCAQNGSSKTNYASRVIIVTAGPLSTQRVILSLANDKSYFNTSGTTLSWQPIFGTTKYSLETDTIEGDFTSSKAKIVLTSNTKYTLYFSEGQYIWRVKATNDTLESLYSDTRTFFFDRTIPSAVSGLAASSTSVTTGIKLTWNPAIDNLSGVKSYEVFLYEKTKSDTVSVVGYQPLVVNAPSSGNPVASINYSLSNVTLLWQVRAIDAAGNKGPLSGLKNFITTSNQ